MSVYYYAVCEKCRVFIEAHTQASGRIMPDPLELANFITKHASCKDDDGCSSLRFADEHEIAEWDNGGRVAKIRVQEVV